MSTWGAPTGRDILYRPGGAAGTGTAPAAPGSTGNPADDALIAKALAAGVTLVRGTLPPGTPGAQWTPGLYTTNPTNAPNQGLTPDQWNVMAGMTSGGGGTASTAPGAVVPGGTTPAAGGPTDVQKSGIAILQAALDRYGLPSSMLDFAKGEITGGASPDQVLLDLYQRPEFADRFPGIIARQKAGLAPMSPEEAIQYEGHLSQTARAYGLPSDFGSRETAQHLIGQDVSVAEADKRIVDGFAEVTKMPPEVRQHFGQYFGANTDAALAAHVLDPTLALPDLDRQVRAAEIGGSGEIHGYDIDRGRAEEIARTGATWSTAQAGFAHLNQLSPLFAESVSETRDLSAEREGVGAEFQLDSSSAQQIQRRLDERSAAFKGGGGSEESAMGQVGLGTRPG